MALNVQLLKIRSVKVFENIVQLSLYCVYRMRDSTYAHLLRSLLLEEKTDVDKIVRNHSLVFQKGPLFSEIDKN